MNSPYWLPAGVGLTLVVLVMGLASSGRVSRAEPSLAERCSDMGGEWLYNSQALICLKADGTRLAYNAGTDAFGSAEDVVVGAPMVLAAETEIKTEIAPEPVVSSTSCEIAPKFSDYSTDATFKGRPTVDFSTNLEAKLYRTAITKDVARGVNFAGKYVVSTWGCGAGCVGSAVVNAESGKILEYGLQSTGYDFEAQSNLLDARKLGYYSIKDDELIQLCK